MEVPKNWRLQKQRGLVGEVCPDCDTKIFPIRLVCPECGHGGVKLDLKKELSGSVFNSEDKLNGSEIIIQDNPVPAEQVQG